MIIHSLRQFCPHFASALVICGSVLRPDLLGTIMGYSVVEGGAMGERVRVEMVSFESKALKENPLGDPAVRDLPVLLPPGYDDSGARRYPVLYGLAGFTGRGSTMLNIDP